MSHERGERLHLSSLSTTTAGEFISEREAGRAERATAAAASVAAADAAHARSMLASTVAAVSAKVQAQGETMTDELARVKGELQARFDLLTAMISDLSGPPATPAHHLHPPTAAATPTPATETATAAAAGGLGGIARLAQVEGAFAVLQADVGDLLGETHARIQGLDAMFATMEGRVSELREEVNKVDAASAEQGKASALANDEMERQVRTVYDGLCALESSSVSKFAQSDAAVSGVASAVDELRAELAAEREARQELEAQVAELKGEVYEAHQHIQAHYVTRAQVHEDLDSLHAAVTQRADNRIESLTQSVLELSKSVASVHSSVAAAEADIRANVDALTQRVSRNTHVSVANDIAFRNLKDKLAGLVFGASHTLAPLASSSSSAASAAAAATAAASAAASADDEIARFLASTSKS